MSNQNISILTLAILASTAVAANRFVNALGAQVLADANAIGVARSPAAIGELIPVDVQGTAVVEAGAAFAKGATIKVDATGRAITWVTSGARVAVALEAATAAGQLVEVLLIDNAA
jgi:uncharacterized ParB-like nuclease family protein